MTYFENEDYVQKYVSVCDTPVDGDCVAGTPFEVTKTRKVQKTKQETSFEDEPYWREIEVVGKKVEEEVTKCVLN